jgi:hypothetical protein
VDGGTWVIIDDVDRRSVICAVSSGLLIACSSSTPTSKTADAAPDVDAGAHVDVGLDYPFGTLGNSCSIGGMGFDTGTPGLAIDRRTCLAWERDDPTRSPGACPPGRDDESKLCWAEALKYCQGLILGGMREWRLPGVEALRTIVASQSSPAVDSTVFPQARRSLYWTSDQVGEKVMAVDFANGGVPVANVGPDEAHALRCVTTTLQFIH